MGKHSAYVKSDGVVSYDDLITYNKDILSHKDKKIFIEITEAKPFRSDNQNRYMRFTYKEFLVPAYFQTEEEAHQYYTAKFLTEVDVLDLNDNKDFVSKLNRISQMASRILSRKYHDDKVEIKWVKSSSFLKTHEMEDYLQKYRTDVQTELHITIPMPNQVSY